MLTHFCKTVKISIPQAHVNTYYNKTDIINNMGLIKHGKPY